MVGYSRNDVNVEMLNVLCEILTDKYNNPEAFNLVKCYLCIIRKITGIMLQSIMKAKLFRYFVFG